MLHFILILLKIIGMVLLGILSLLLTLTLFVLFVPIRYQSKGSFYGEPRLICTFSWLFYILFGKIVYEEGKHRISLRIFGYPLLGRVKKQRPVKTAKKSRRKKKVSKVDEDKAAKKPLETATPSGQEAKQRLLEAQKVLPEEKAKANIKQERVTEAEIKVEPEIAEKISFFKKISSYLSGLIIKIKKGFRNLKFTIKRIYGKLKEIRKNIHSFIDYLKSDEWKRLYGFIKKEIIGIIRHIRPRKYYLKARFGFSDPADTGIVLGCLAIVPFASQKKVTIIPDFNEKVLEGEYFIKGRVRCFNLLFASLRIYFNKDIKSLRKKWQEHGERS